MKKILLIVFALSNFLYAGFFSNAGYPGFYFLEEPISVRQIALGAAGTAAANARGFAFYNPALLSYTPASYFGLEYGGNYLNGDLGAGDFQRAQIERGWIFSDWYFGLDFHTFFIDGIYRSDEKAVYYLKSFSSGEYMGFLDAGYKTERFSAAIMLSTLMSSVAPEAQYYGLSLSTGATYTIIPGKLTSGIAAFHQGTSESSIEGSRTFGDGPALPRSGRLGIAWSDTIKNLPGTFLLDVVYRDIDERIMVPVGLEVKPINSIAVRAGTTINHDVNRASLGAGFERGPLTCDFALTIGKVEDNTEYKWLLGFSWTLKKAQAMIAVSGPALHQVAPDSAMAPEKIKPKATSDSVAVPAIMPDTTAIKIKVAPIQPVQADTTQLLVNPETQPVMPAPQPSDSLSR